jgi:molybdopterin-guanine dinucleotide biosynthesis protein A
VGGQRILDRVADALRAVSSDILLVSNAADAASWLPGVTTIPDGRSERGSLVGIHTALTHALAGGSALVVAWDMPFVSEDLLRMIRDRGRHTPFAVVPEGPTGLEPMCAMYTAQALPTVAAAIDAGDLRLTNMLARLPSFERVPLATIANVGDPAHLFFNVNTADDLAAAERMAASA